jgi:hypothetical protein
MESAREGFGDHAESNTLFECAPIDTLIVWARIHHSYDRPRRHSGRYHTVDRNVLKRVAGNYDIHMTFAVPDLHLCEVSTLDCFGRVFTASNSLPAGRSCRPMRSWPPFREDVDRRRSLVAQELVVRPWVARTRLLYPLPSEKCDPSRELPLVDREIRLGRHVPNDSI